MIGKGLWKRTHRVDHSGAELDAILSRAAQLTELTSADTGKVLAVGTNGDIVASDEYLDERVAYIANTFSASTAYSTGAYVIYSNKLYRFTADHAAGSWTGTDAVEIKLADDVEDVTVALSGGTASATVSTANTNIKIYYSFVKGQTVTYTNGCAGAVTVKLYTANSGEYAISAGLPAGKSITFEVDYDGCIAIGGYCAGTGTVTLTVSGIYGMISDQIDGFETFSISDLEFTGGGFVRFNNGQISANASFKYTDMIPVKQGSQITYSLHGLNNAVAVIAAYDADGVYYNNLSIGYDSTAASSTTVLFTGTYTVPAGISQIRICNYSTSTSADDTVSVVSYYNKISRNTEDIAEIQDTLATLDIVNQWEGKKWVAFGTSITDNWSTNAVITQGTHAGEPTGKYPPYLLTLSELSSDSFVNRGIAGGMINGHILYYIRYYTSDMANADLITIEGCVNDYASGIPLGSVGDTVPYTNTLLTDSTADGTFAGACYCAFKEAQINAPNAVVVLLTETTGKDHTGYANYGQTRKNGLGLYQDDYIEMTKKVAEFVGIPIIECGRDSMINAQHPEYIADHIHHTYLGGYQYARTIWSKLKGIPNLSTELPS